MKKTKQLSIPVQKILSDARNDLQQAHLAIETNGDGNFYSANNVECLLTSRVHRAETLIGLVEVAHCGSVGGFDPEQRKHQEKGHGLRARLDHLISIYGADEEEDEDGVEEDL